MVKNSNYCYRLRANLLLFVFVLLGVVGAAADANWTQRFLSPESFMTLVFPLGSLLLFIGIIVLSELKDSCDMMSGKSS